MQKPLEIRFHQMEPSPAIEARIREKVARLEKLYDRIVSCRVVVEKDHRNHRKGNLYRVRVDIGVPGRELVVNRKGPKNHAHEDVYVALRDAFNAAARQLEDFARERRGQIKVHEAPPHGRIKLLNREAGYGFIETPDGQEIYFHRNAVVNDSFERLAIGNEVRFVYAEGESPHGPQATTVHPLGKHHIVEPLP